MKSKSVQDLLHVLLQKVSTMTLIKINKSHQEIPVNSYHLGLVFLLEKIDYGIIRELKYHTKNIPTSDLTEVFSLFILLVL